MLKGLCKAIGVMSLTIPAAVSAPVTWDMSSGAMNGSGYGNTMSFTQDGISMTASAWADTHGRFASNAQIEEAALRHWNGSGLGIQNQRESGRSPGHAISNSNRYDMVLFSFSEAVTLDALNIGWGYQDTDASVLAYTGSQNPTLNGMSWSALTESDWSIVGNYANLPVNRGTGINSEGTASNFWLVGAYNPEFGGNLSNGNDHFKLRGLTTSRPTIVEPPAEPPAEVPEPGTVVLLGLGLLGLTAARRKYRS